MTALRIMRHLEVEGWRSKGFLLTSGSVARVEDRDFAMPAL